MRSSWLVLALSAWVATARAEWQPSEAPPVPPETEAAERERSSAPPEPVAAPAAVPVTPLAAVDEGKSAASTGPAPTPRPVAPATSAPTRSPAPPNPASTQPETDGAAPVNTGDPLSMFPPAPPPVAAGKEPKPETALSDFAPAPVPDEPGTLPQPQTVTPAPSQPAPTSSEPPLNGGDKRWTAAALFGVGATFDNTVAGVNPMGFGFGVRGDYKLLPQWSVGARMVYFVGGSVELPTNEVSMQSWLLAAEGAYVLELDPVTIQPGVAMGIHVRETNHRNFVSFAADPMAIVAPDKSRPGLYVAPGVNVSLPLSIVSPTLAPLIAGADVRVDFVFGQRLTSNIQLLLQTGLRF